MKKIKILTLGFITTLLLSACATGPTERFSPDSSYLKGKPYSTDGAKATLMPGQQAQEEETQQRFRFISPFKLKTSQTKTAEDVLSRFSNSKTIKITANELPLKDYLHQVLGEQLSVSYILADEIKKDNQPVTLNLQDSITERKLFTLTEELLTQRNYVIRVDDNIFYIHKAEGKGAKGNVVYGYGKQFSDVPQTSLDIIQMVSFEYGMQTSLGNTLRVLLGIKAIPDQQRNSITIQGKRKDIVRALELIQIMDQPRLQNRKIGTFKSTFLTTDELVKKLAELLGQEGIGLSEGKISNQALSVVQIEKQGMLIFFANKLQVIERAVFWAKQLDKPIKTVTKQYFIYQPQYSRAIDMGESLEALIGNAGGIGTIGTSTSAASQNQQASSSRRSVRSASSENMKMVVDERANALIFYASGEDYQLLLPLIKRLDVLPKQVILEVMIAEVTLTDEFKLGVEFALTKGDYGLSTLGAFMGDGFGGLSYLLQGESGQIVANLLQTNSLVNILSRPSIVVRDGVTATINVGTDIPIIGETTSNPILGENQTTKIEYRKTGIELTVTPTINAQGVILMEIKQKISNQVEAGSTVSGSPSIFERSIQTEVVAESGQTIMLGGLISENRTRRESRVPFFASIPLIGNLFKAETEGGDKTELVVLVTPRIIESADEWDDILAKFSQGVTELKINQ